MTAGIVFWLRLLTVAEPTQQETSADHRRLAVRGMFNRIAPTYDLLNRLLSLGIDRRWRKKTIELMRIDARSVVLDLACGTGDLSEQAARRSAKVVFGVDPSKEMLLRARTKLRYQLTRSYFVESYGEELPLAAGVCTHAMIAFGIRNVQERPRAFAEVFRILKPGGKFAVLEFTPMDRRFVSWLFNLYFHRILPVVGGIISRDRQAYDYLPQSVARFVTSADLAQEAEQAGFIHLQTQAFALGIATCVLLQKPH